MRGNTKYGITCIALLGLAGCTLGPLSRDKVQLTIQVPRRNPALRALQSLGVALGSRSFAGPPQDDPTIPATVGDFDCYFVNVSGSGIPLDPTLASGAPIGSSPSAGTPSTTCTYPGISAFAPSDTQTVTLTVPAGPSRAIQMLGLAPAGGGCQAITTLGAYLNQLSSSPDSLIFSLGETTMDLESDTSVTIADSYNSSNPSPAFGCTAPTGAPSASSLSVPLVAIYFGATSSISFSDSVSASSSWANDTTGWSSGPTTLVTPDLAAVVAASSSSPTPLEFSAGGPTQFPRVDFIFDAGAVSYTNYSIINFAILGAGGCSDATPPLSTSVNSLDQGTNSNGWNTGIWSAASTAWITSSVGSASTTPISFPAPGYNPGFTPTQAAVSLPGLGGSGTYIVVSMRATDTSCSIYYPSLLLQGASMTLFP